MTNPDEKALLAQAAQHLYPNYRQAQCVFVRGKGCEVWDKSGKRYLDLPSHCQPRRWCGTASRRVSPWLAYVAVEAP